MIMTTMIKMILKKKDNRKKDNKKYLQRKSLYEWSFLTITITVTTNKRLITNKALIGENKQ